MEACLFDLAKNEVQSLVNLVKKEAQYLCCYNSNAENFEQQKEILAAKHKDMKRKFQKGKGVLSFTEYARQWEHEANDVINIDTTIKKKLFFRWCPNCWWQYQRGRELVKETQHIEVLLKRCESNIGDPKHVPNINSLSPHDFIPFESRKSKFQDLMKVLQDGTCNMIGLHGMGGEGKTSMAKEVGHNLKESNLIDRFIFLVISQSPDFKKIRGELAKELGLESEEINEEELPGKIFSKITETDEKLLIILDDVWKKFDLTKNLGIPSQRQSQRCNLLITTRISSVCSEMGCQMIKLQKLTEEEALDLFEKNAIVNKAPYGLKGLPQKIVKHCGGLPVAIVAVARALKNKPTSDWKDALKTLEDGVVDPNLKEAYNCLKLSYDYLKNQMAKDLLLVSSTFPEDAEIPRNYLIKIGIGLCSFNENDEYHLKRSEVANTILELVNSSLLMNGEEESVKMHDLVHEVALKIVEKDIQSLVDLRRPIKGNLRYLFWKNDAFPDKFDGNKLEVLSIYLKYSEDMNVSDAFFKEMACLKVLVLVNDDGGRIPALSLSNSIQPLKNIRTIILEGLELGDISILGNLLSLTIVWFNYCSINELPREFLKLNKLRSLEVECCNIKNNNPFEVIESCSQLEELTFVDNNCDSEQKDEISERGSPLTLHRYCISSEELPNNFEKYGSLSRCFRIDELRHFVSDATFQQLIVRAELLILDGEDAQRTWKNLIPDIVPIDEGGIFNDLIVLHLSRHPELECLIDTKDHESDVTVFCNLAELHLLEMSIEDLCRGPPPSSFLEPLEIMKLKGCHELKRILPNGNYNLCCLKTMKLEDCPKLTSVFQPSTARSLKKLEKLTIRSCNGLENIIVGQDGDSNQKSHCDPLLPKLKILQIAECNKLRIILPILFAGGLASLEKISLHESEHVEYIFDKFQGGEDAILPSLRELELSEVPSLSGIFREYHCSSTQKASPLPLSLHNSNKKNESLVAGAFSWVQACCSLNKWRHASNGSLDHTDPPKLDASTDGVSPLHAAQSLLVQSLKNITKIKLVECGDIISLSFLSIAASSMSLEYLTIQKCHKLKCITENEGVAQADKYCSIFPRLENLIIKDCKELEFLFISEVSGGLEKLKSLTIEKVPELKYIVGNYQQQQYSSNQNQNGELHFQLLHLENFSIGDAPKINSICTKNFKMVLSSLQKIKIRNYQDKSFVDHNLVGSRTTEERDASTDGDPFLHLAEILLVQSLKTLRKIKLVNCQNLISLATLSIAASTMALENLTICECHKLKCITAYEDAGTHMNYKSIFPKLKELQVSDCDALEYLIPAYAFRSPSYLESLSISKAPMLKYVFGRSQHEDILIPENQIKQDPIDFPALSNLSIRDVPQLVSICPENYYLGGLALRSIAFGGFPMFPMRPCNEFLVFWLTKQQETKVIEMRLQTLEKLAIDGFKVEEIFDSTHEPLTSSLPELELRNLSELEHICVGPKRIMCFHCLQRLIIHSCKKLKVIFSTSMVRSLPMLENLVISECEELVHIVEEEYAMSVDDHLCHEPCFPNLQSVYVIDCDKLKYLFSITLSDTLPKLEDIDITKAHELEHVLIRRGEMKEMVMKDVLPQLEWLWLTELPNLVSICHGIDFQTSANKWGVKIRDCPNFSFYETSATRLQTGPKSADSEAKQQSLKKKVPIHTSPNPTNLPARYNTQASAKNFEDEEGEEEQGGLRTSRHPRSHIKASSTFSEEKFETSLDETTTTPNGSKTQDSEVWEHTDQMLSDHSNGRRGLETQQSTIGSSNFGTKEDAKKIVEEDIILEKSKMIDLSSNSNVKGSDELVGKVAQNDRRMIDAQQSTKGTNNFTKGELVDKEMKIETNMMEPKSQEEITRHDIQSYEEEESKGDEDLVVSCSTPLLSEQTSEAILPPSTISLKASTGLNQIPQATLGKPVDDVNIQVSDKSHINDEGIKETNAGEDESMANSSDNLSVDPSNLKQMEQESSACSKGQIEHHDVTINSYFNQALNAGAMQKIVEMMKSEGSETSLLEEALKTHPQLCLSINDRSKQMLCISYKALIDILSILTTRTPFTITEADKRLLEEKLKDACLLGFNKDWLESIKTRAVSYDDISEILKGLESDLKSNELILVATRNHEAEAAREVELAQQNLDAALQKHNHLLKDRQRILARQNQYSEMISAKNKPFGF